jgi:SagB-type dehydrogenase family enzyme
MTPNAGREFMRKTYYDHVPVSAQSQGLPQPPLELPLDPQAERIKLPAPEAVGIPEIRLRAAIENRQSVRKYAEQPLTIGELSFLLWCTQGVKELSRRPVTLRNVPSAGARHAFETYLLINRVEGIDSGLYRFGAIDHVLVAQDLDAGIAETLTTACLKQRMVSTCGVTFFWVAVAERMEWRYPVRGYRYLHLDAGHVCQNLYLAAEAVGCGVCAIAAFDDDLVNEALDLDGENLFAIYVATVGKRSG